MSEADELKALSKNERRYLNGRVCWGCDMPLGRQGCGTGFPGGGCCEASRSKRRAACLAEYKPRRVATLSK